MCVSENTFMLWCVQTSHSANVLSTVCAKNVFLSDTLESCYHLPPCAMAEAMRITNNTLH